MQHKQRGRTTSGGSSPLNPHSFSIDDPNVYISDAKAVLAEDQGLSTRNRDYITEVLERLAERVTSAELSRNMVVGELVTLRERFQVINLIVSWVPINITAYRAVFTFSITRPYNITGFRSRAIKEMRRASTFVHFATKK